MQTAAATGKFVVRFLSLTAVLTLSAALGCSFNTRQKFSSALKKIEGTGIEQVNEAALGAPFFSVGVLNPVWKLADQQQIVKIPELELIDQNGKTHNQNFFKGKITFVAFIFTTCSGFCPNLIQQLKVISRKIGDDPHVQYVAITVDTERDTPDQLKNFANKLKLPIDKSWTLFTGNHDTIYSLIKTTFASQAFQKPRPGPRNFAHSEHFYVIDPEGRLRGIINGTRIDSEASAAKIVALLDEGL